MAIPNIFSLSSSSFFALFLLQLHLAFGNIPLGSKLVSSNDHNPSWLSSSGDFAFGFRRINNNNTYYLFLLAIWFNKIPEQTMVWNADIQAPIPLGSTVQLMARGLSLINPQGQVLYVWPDNGLLQGDVSFAEMRNDGNFVLVSSNSSYLWQSFNTPTDTLLPSQTLDRNSKLSSRLSPSNYTKGRFQLYFDSGNLALTQTGWPTESRYTDYFHINSTSSFNDSALQLVFNSSSGNIYVETEGGDEIDVGLGGSGFNLSRYYYRATLDYYGVFSLYSHPRGSNNNNNNETQQVWSTVGLVPEDICRVTPSDMGSGCCGYNSYCTWNDNNKRPTCSCPEGYSWVDPTDEFGGCQPDYSSFGCGAGDVRSRENPEEVYEMKTLPNVNWPVGDYERLNGYTQDECEKSCMNDCNCVVAISNIAKDCWKKRLPLSNGRIETSPGLTTALLKIRIQPLGKEKEDQDRVQPAVLGSLIGSLVINTLLVAAVVSIILLCKPRKKSSHVSSFVETNMHSFSYEALKEATNEFSEEVGRGSFGTVYRGTLLSGTDTVVAAVKRLDRLAQERETEFKNELSSMGKTCHRNLVRLIGFCDEGIHRLLVYEFMSNGSLADILFGKVRPHWNLRVRFALGIARGMVYLHEECETPIIHCDIKPQNILIDEHFMPKISDFGLAKLLYSNKSRTHTMIRGTRGYVAPEWFRNIPVTAKVDVYSYGVMLLEIICCRRSVEMDVDEGVEENEAILTDWAYDCYMERRIEILVENDEEAMADMRRVKKWVMIGLWCIQENPEIRPNMKAVMQMLEGVVEVPNPPSSRS